MRSAIEEVVRLDENRHRSWFQVGFLDELESRGASLERAPSNEPSRGWYVAGVVLALADRGRRVAIADLFDHSRDDLTRLLDDTHEACGHAALAIFEALCETGRRAEALALVAPAVVCRGGEKFLELLLYEFRDVSDGASSAEIVAFAALLDRVVRAYEQAGLTLPPECLWESALLGAREHRRRGEFERAASLLDRIESSNQPSLGAREGMERGFSACRMRGGSEAPLPPSSADFPAIVAAAAAGRGPVPGSASTADRGPNVSGSVRPSGVATDLRHPPASIRSNDAR